MDERSPIIEGDAKRDRRVVFKSSDALLNVVDIAAAKSFASRSDYIRGAVVERLRREGVIGELRSA